MATVTIPLLTGSQEFSIKLGDNTYRLRVIWRDANEGGWFLDIKDVNNSPILLSVPMRVGHDLLEQHQHLGIGHMYVTNNNEITDEPTYDDMGRVVTLTYWV